MSTLIFSVSPSATSITEGGAITFTVGIRDRVGYQLDF